MTEPIWFDKPCIIIDKDHLKKFVWLPGMTYNEKTNAVVRFTLYLSLLGYLYFNRREFLYFFVLVLIGLFYMHYKQRQTLYRWLNVSEATYQQTGGGQDELNELNDLDKWKAKYDEETGDFLGYSNDLVEPDVLIEPKTNQRCKRSTPNNPFGNALPGDNEILNSTPICDPSAMKQTIEKNFELDLFSDINDIFQRNNSQRQFTVNPSTTVPNDRQSFMKWLWDTPYVGHDGDSEALFKANY